MTSHPAIVARLAQWREDRAEYAVHMEGVYRAAETATNGALLNARGWAAKVDPWSLFVGPGHHMRLRAYGSPELVEWVEAHPVLTFAQWERQHGRVPGRQWGDLLDPEPESMALQWVMEWDVEHDREREQRASWALGYA